MSCSRSIFFTRDTTALSTSPITCASMSSLLVRTSFSVSADKGALTSMGEYLDQCRLSFFAASSSFMQSLPTFSIKPRASTMLSPCLRAKSATSYGISFGASSLSTPLALLPSSLIAYSFDALERQRRDKVSSMRRARAERKWRRRRGRAADFLPPFFQGGTEQTRVPL